MRTVVRLTLVGLFAGGWCLPAAAPAGGKRANNPFGIMVRVSGGGDSTGMYLHLRLARELCGEWAYVRVGANLREPQPVNLVRMLVACRAMHLIPVVSAMRAPDRLYEPDENQKPRTDPDGTLGQFEAYHERWLRWLYEQGVTVPYFEYGNEVNGGYYGQHPEVYARMAIAVSRAFKRVDPDLQFVTAGMAGCADDYYDKMLTLVPELKDHVDAWGLHPYAANHPPMYDLDNYGLRGHQWTAKALAKHGIDRPVFVMTETGYELGNQKDRRFPKITEELRAEYMVTGYQKIWLPDPRVRAVMPFELQDVRWQGWSGWDFVREDFSLTPMYEAIRDLPKPPGQDYLPSGPCSVRGWIVDRELERGVPAAFVWIRRVGLGCYAAVTDERGAYAIEHVPAGRYRIAVFRDGFEPVEGGWVELTGQKPKPWNARMKRVGLIPGGMDGPVGKPVAEAWTPLGDVQPAEVFLVDRSVRRSGRASQRVRAVGKPVGLWAISNYESALPERVYAVQVWVKTRGLVRGKGSGVRVSLIATNSYATHLSESSIVVPLEGDCDWRPLNVSLRAQPRARRLKVVLQVDAEAGVVWFDDVHLFDADWPIPSAIAIATSRPADAGKIEATVLGPDGRQRLHHAVVFTVPWNLWATTGYMGRCRIDDVPPGRYTVWACCDGFASGRTDVTVEPGRTSPATIQLGEVPVPSKLVNADFEQIGKLPTWFSGWQRWGSTDGIVADGWHKGTGIPEHPDGLHPHSGKGFYGVVAGSNIKTGGIYQTIAVTPDAEYEVSAWSYTYHTSDGIRGDVANRIGVDPLGGSDPDSPYVIWTPYRPSHRKWTRVSLRVRPVKGRMTIFLNHLQVHGIMFNVNCFDDVQVRKLSGGR